METPKAKIERILSGPTDFKFGDYIGRGFDIVQKDWGSFIGFTVIFLVLVMVISLIPFVGSIANQLLVTPALTVGFFLYANKLDKGERPEFGTFFKGFDFAGQLVISALIMMVIIGITFIPFGIVVWKYGWVEWYMELMKNPRVQPADMPDLPPVWSFLLFLPAMFLSVAYAWTYHFVGLYKLEFWDALEASRRLLTRHWLMFFLFAIVTGLIAGAGVLLLCIGLLFTLPAYMCMSYAAFADVTKLNEDPLEGEGIEQHLIV
ncbi:MAG: hypothetical protein GC192_04045 [Bacteroidetes bacterium]|nr:hypothetical protein [Bacteroidota bacterium]